MPVDDGLGMVLTIELRRSRNVHRRADQHVFEHVGRGLADFGNACLRLHAAKFPKLSRRPRDHARSLFSKCRDHKNFLHRRVGPIDYYGTPSPKAPHAVVYSFVRVQPTAFQLLMSQPVGQRMFRSGSMIPPRKPRIPIIKLIMLIRNGS